MPNYEFSVKQEIVVQRAFLGPLLAYQELLLPIFGSVRIAKVFKQSNGHQSAIKLSIHQLHYDSFLRQQVA